MIAPPDLVRVRWAGLRELAMSVYLAPKKETCAAPARVFVWFVVAGGR
jgi:hypothetical protein